MLRTFLFDLDGTLLDSMPLILASMRHTLIEHLGAAPSDAVCLQGVGTPLRAQFAVFLGAASTPARVEAMFDTYQAHNAIHHDALLRVFAGVAEGLAALRAAGGRIGIVTSKMGESALRGLEVGGLAPLVDTLIALEDVTHHKPHPEPVLLGMSRLGGVPERTVFVGDAPFDLEAGRAAGVRTAAVAWGPFAREVLAPHHPDWWLSTPADIAALASVEP